MKPVPSGLIKATTEGRVTTRPVLDNRGKENYLRTLYFLFCVIFRIGCVQLLLTVNGDVVDNVEAYMKNV